MSENWVLGLFHFSSLKQTEQNNTTWPNKYSRQAYLRWHPSHSQGIPSFFFRTLASGSARGEKMTFHGLRSSVTITVAVYEISGIKLQHGRPPKMIFVLLDLSKPTYSLTVTPNQKAFSQIWSHFQLSERWGPEQLALGAVTVRLSWDIWPFSNSPLEGPEFGQAADWAYNVWVLVDVMEVQGQDVVLASNVHAIIILVHAQDPVVRCVEEISKVMGSPSGSQLCLTQKYNFKSAVIFAARMLGQLTHSSWQSCIPTWLHLMVFHQHGCNQTLHIRQKCYW